MKKTYLLLTLITTIFSANSFAATTYQGKSITGITAYADGEVVVFFTPSQVNDSGCGRSDNLTIKLAADGGNAMYSAALQASALGKTIDFKSKSSSGCGSHYEGPIPYRINVNY